MTSGAQCLLAFLVRRGARASGASWWGQRRMAEAMEVSDRTIRRYLAELIVAGLVESVRRGSTSNMYRVLSCGKLQGDVRSDRTKLSDRGAPVLLTESRESENKQASPAAPVENCERNPPQPSAVRNAPPPGMSAADLMPPPTIRSEAGREMPNPDYFRVQQALRRARDRIRVARSPEAYVRAIIEREARAG